MIKTTEMMLEELKEYSNPAARLSRMGRNRVNVFRLCEDYMRLIEQFRDTYWQAVFTDRLIFLLSMRLRIMD